MATTTSRHRALRSIIAEHPVSNQGDLVGLLAARGFDVTQATVSRDLQAVGAVKARDAAGSLRYVLSSNSVADSPHGALARALAEYAETILVSGNLVVVKTPPGAAHVVALAVDGTVVPGVLGTVAGDDTMLIVVDEETGGTNVARYLEGLGDNA